MLDRWRDSLRQVEEAVWKLVWFYGRTGRQVEAFAYLEQVLAATPDPEQKAVCFLSLGQLLEQTEDYADAIAAYRKAFALEPSRTDVWYLIHNNLGFCLNQIGQHAEAEGYCRQAIAIDAARHNAYKNLGVALDGQGRNLEAARAYVTAATACPEDPRALRHLQALLARHPEVEAEIRGALEGLHRPA